MRTLFEIRFEIRLRFSPSLDSFLFFLFLRIHPVLASNSFSISSSLFSFSWNQRLQSWSLTQVERVEVKNFERSNYYKQLLKLKCSNITYNLDRLTSFNYYFRLLSRFELCSYLFLIVKFCPTSILFSNGFVFIDAFFFYFVISLSRPVSKTDHGGASIDRSIKRDENFLSFHRSVKINVVSLPVGWQNYSKLLPVSTKAKHPMI